MQGPPPPAGRVGWRGGPARVAAQGIGEAGKKERGVGTPFFVFSFFFLKGFFFSNFWGVSLTFEAPI